MATPETNRSILLTTKHFGSGFASLPEGLQDMIIADAVDLPNAIKLAALDSTIDILSAPFKNVQGFYLEARKQVLRVNTLELEADDFIISQLVGSTQYGSTSTGRFLTAQQAKGVRFLELSLKIIARGCDWANPRVIQLTQAHREIFRTLPQVFPMLTSLTINARDVGEHAQDMHYTTYGIPANPRHLNTMQKVEANIYTQRLVFAFVQLNLAQWRKFSAPPEKTLVLYHTADVAVRLACKQVVMKGPDAKTGQIGIKMDRAEDAGEVEPPALSTWSGILWEWGVWPKVRVEFTYE